MRISFSRVLFLLLPFSLQAEADTQRPNTVSGVRASAISSSAIRLSWDAPWDNVGVDGYNIYRDGSYYSTLFNATNYIDTGLTESRHYEYSVVAFDRARNYSTLSGQVGATTHAADGSAVPVTAAAPPDPSTVPQAPSRVSVEVIDSQTMQVNWQQPAGPVTGYNIYRDGHYHGTVRDALSYTASSLNPGNDYRWQIVAFNDIGFSTLSTEISASTPASGSSQPVAAAVEQASASDSVPDGYQLVFNEEFRGSSLDNGLWSSRYRWGPWMTINNEQQFYVDTLNEPGFGHDPFVFDGEHLTIRAIPTPSHLRTSANNKPYLSGALNSYGKFRMRYGYVEMRARLPAGKGLWPAFWLLHDHENGIRPEIDVVEMLGDDPRVIYQTYHHYQGQTLQSTPSYQVWNTDFSAGFHTYAMHWEPGTITWYVDGEARNSYQSNAVPTEDMYLLVNLAVGGNWPGSPDGSTPFPADMTIDYIRAYSPD